MKVVPRPLQHIPAPDGVQASPTVPVEAGGRGCLGPAPTLDRRLGPRRAPRLWPTSSSCRRPAESRGPSPNVAAQGTRRGTGGVPVFSAAGGRPRKGEGNKVCISQVNPGGIGPIRSVSNLRTWEKAR